MFPTSNRDVTRFPLLMFVIPVSPLGDRGQAGRCTLVITPEDASVIDDGVGAPVSVIIDVEEQSRTVHVDPGSVVVLVLGFILTQVLRPQPRHGSVFAGLQCDGSRTTSFLEVFQRQEVQVSLIL